MQVLQEGLIHHTHLYETSPLQVGVVGWGRGALRAEIGGGGGGGFLARTNDAFVNIAWALSSTHFCRMISDSRGVAPANQVVTRHYSHRKICYGFSQ